MYKLIESMDRFSRLVRMVRRCLKWFWTVHSVKHVVATTAEGWSHAGVDLHLGENVLEVVIRLLNGVCMGALVCCHHNALIPWQPLHLLLHVAPLVSASVVASASINACEKNKNKFIPGARMNIYNEKKLVAKRNEKMCTKDICLYIHAAFMYKRVHTSWTC